MNPNRFPARRIDYNPGSSFAVQSRPTTVTGEPARPDDPCVVAITMGSPSNSGNRLLAHLQDRAGAREYKYKAIRAGSDLREATDVLQRHVPTHAIVVLINTDASRTEVATLRTALPSQNIIADPRGEPLDPKVFDAWTALDNLPEAPRFTPDASRYQEHAAAIHGPVGCLELSAAVSNQHGPIMSSGCIHGGYIPPPSGSDFPSITEVGRPATTAFHGRQPVPGEPCVVVISMGNRQGGRVKMLEDSAESTANTRNYQCLIINVGVNLLQATTMLGNLVPVDANVVLIEADASAEEVETIRAALPTQNILDQVQIEHVSSGSGDPLPGLDALPRRSPPQPSQQRVVHYQVSGFRGFINPSFQPSFLPLNGREPFGPETVVRASPINPANALSGALGLEADLFTQFNETHDLSLLATLVKRALKETKNSNLKPMLRRLVEEMAAKPALAERVFAALKGGDERCDDRVSFTLHQAELALLVQPAMDGVLNKEEMFDLARKVFRRTCIDELAKDKVKEIKRTRGLDEHEEEIETHLAYYSGLHEALELGGVKPYGKFISSPISGVDANDIAAAKRAVLNREGNELWGFFATWEPWQDVLRNKYPNQVDEIENAITDGEYWKNIEREVEDDLEKRKVPSILRPAALTQELKKRGQDKQRELWLALTMTAWKEQNA